MTTDLARQAQAETAKQTQANDIVRRYSLGALVPGIIPLPLLDVVLVAGTQLKMLHRLAKLYGTPFSEQLGKSAIASLVGGVGSGTLATVSTHLLRSVPILGQVAGILTMSGFGAAATYAVGKVFIQHFETGGTLLTFDAEKVRAYYAQQFSQGRTLNPISYVGVQP